MYRKHITEDYLPGICPLVQICDTSWLTYHQNESIVMYKKFKIKNPFSRNMFSRSNMDYSLDDLTSDRVNESV